MAKHHGSIIMTCLGRTSQLELELLQFSMYLAEKEQKHKGGRFPNRIDGPVGQ